MLCHQKELLLTRDEALDLLPLYPSSEYSNSFHYLFEGYGINDGDVIKRISEKLIIGKNGISQGWIRVFVCYQSQFENHTDFREMGSYLNQIETILLYKEFEEYDAISEAKLSLRWRRERYGLT